MKIELDVFETPCLREEQEKKVPQYYCRTCDRCKNNRCDVFETIIRPNYNRCFFHSAYKPVSVKFRPMPIEQLNEIIKLEQMEREGIDLTHT